MDEMRAHPRQPTGHTTAFLALRKKRKRQKKNRKALHAAYAGGPCILVGLGWGRTAGSKRVEQTIILSNLTYELN